ncbi:MAG: 3',5'-cyclic-AMP phosphodiesterase [Vibrionaceae bacterium]
MQTYHFAVEPDLPIRLLQITDPHLFANPQQSLLGVNTLRSLEAVIAAVDSRQVAFDFVLTTGDLSQDQSVESYHAFAHAIAHWQQPKFWLPGNHDNQEAMQSAFQAPHFLCHEQILLGDNWQLVLLNSQFPGETHGFLSQAQMDILQAALNSEQERHTIVVLHHHPIACGSAWLDNHQLHNKAHFWQLLADFPQVKAVVCGHIHQDFDVMYQQRQVLGAPSTCIQFLPNCVGFALDSCAPGWRELELHADGKIATRIGRIAPGSFLPDVGATGY